MIADVRKLALQHEADVLEENINWQIANGTNPIYGVGTSEEIVGVLSKAKVVRQLMDNGMTIQEALRELGRRVRMIAGD